MLMKVWVNFFKSQNEDELEVSIPYSSPRSALRARERQKNRDFVGDPQEIEFDFDKMGDTPPRRCDDCTIPKKECALCLTLEYNNDK